MVGRKHIIFWTRLWRENRLMLLSSLLILSLPSTAFSSYRMSQTVSCGEGSTKCSSSDPLKGLKQANREFKSVFQVNRGSATDKATVKNSSKKTGFVENLIDTSEEVLGRFSRSISSGRNKRPSIFSDGIIFLTSWFSNHYFTLSSSASQCLSSTQKTWNAIRFRGRGPLSARNPSSANQISEGFAHIFQTGASGLQLVENIDLQSYSREVVNASYSRSESGCEGNSESFDAVGNAPSELGDLSIIYGNNSFAATGEGTNPNMVFAMEQASQNDAFFQGLTSGVFSGFFTAVSSATTAPIQTATFSPTGNGKTFNISRLTDFADSSTASAWGVLTLNQLNSPAPGFHQGTLTKDGQQGQALCMAGLLDDQNTLVCSAQLPSNLSVPVYLFATMTPKASVKMTAPELVGMPGQEVCGDIILEGATQSTTAQLTPSSYYWGPGAFSGQNGQCAGSSTTGVAQVGALETCNVRICTLIAGASLDFNISFQEDSQTTAQEFATVSFQEPPAPVITASSDIASGTVPLFVNFSALEVSGNITSWLVDFGDGYQSTYYNGSNSYLFYTPGEFTVSIRGIDSYGRESNTVSIPISVLPVSGCMNSMASNYNSSATVDDGSCNYDFELTGYWYVFIGGVYQGMGRITQSESSLETFVESPDGNSGAGPFYSSFQSRDSDTVSFSGSPWSWGTAVYNVTTRALTDGYSIWYQDPVSGCTDATALNYNSSASSNDGSCQFANGGSCSSNSQCVSGNCSSGICNAGGSNGTACSQNYECSSNACNNGYCDGGNLAGCTSHAYMNGRFYCFVANDMGFAQARYSAPYIPQFPQGGHLVTITSQQEYDLVVSLIAPHGRNTWLGMTDLAQEGDWQTITGEPLNGWSMWGPGEPNNVTWTGDTSGEHFAQLGNLWGGWPYLINDATASSWMLNSAVYEYDEYTDQTPNPNCSVDYDGDGVCAGVDSNDSNSRESTPVLVSHWKFDGDYNDYGTLGNHGSSNGVALSSAGGGAAQFNSSAAYGGSSLYTGPGYNNFTSGATTVSFWYKADTVANNPLFIDFKMGGGDTFITLSPGSSPGTHRVFWAPRGWGYTVGSQEYSVNGWTQVTIVYNGNGMWNYGGSNVSFYINGTPVSATSWDCCNGGYTSSNQLGRDSFSAMWGDNSRAYSGLLDDVRVYRGILIDSDILNLFNERVSLYFSGVSNGACYLNGTIVSYLTNGTGYCSGNEKYYMNDEQTTLDANGSGVHGGLRYVAGSLANGFVNGAGDDNNTVLLLHMDGAHGSTTFVDSSSSSKTASVSGQSHINTTGSKFGGASAYFDGSGDYISYSSPTDFTFGNGDFTVELWFNKDSGGSWEGALITTADPSDGQGFWLGFQGGSLYWLFGNGYWSFARVPTSFTSSTWHHVAVTRSGNIGRLFLNGIEVDSVTDSTYLTNINNGIKVGGRDVAGQYFPGFIDEVRISNIARYTSNFTPATVAFGGGGCFSNGVDTGTVTNGTGSCAGIYYLAGSATQLPLDGTGNHDGKQYFLGVLANGLIESVCYAQGVNTGTYSNGNGSCGGSYYIAGVLYPGLDETGTGTHTASGKYYVNGSLANGVHGGLTTPGSNTALFMNMDDFSDTSSYAHSMTLNGSPYTSSGKGVFNGGNSLTINSPGAELQFTGPFTIEVQAVINNPSQRQFFVNSAVPWGGHNYGFGLEQYPDGRPISGISFYWGYWGWYGFWLHTSYVPPAGESHHYAITRDASNTWRIFIDGVQTSYQVWQENYSFDPGMPLYGSSEKVLGYMVNGEIDHLIVTNGEALYTSNFTPNNSSIACYVNGVDTGTVTNGTGSCEGVYYIAGTATTLPLDGTGQFNGKEYVNGVALSGLYSDTCYNDGVVVNVLVDGTGYCSGNLTFYFMGTAQTNFDGMGSGTTADGQVFLAGTPANTVVNGVCYNNGFATNDLINGSGKCLSNGQWYIDGIYASRLDNLGNGTWGFNLAATPGKETSSPPGFIDSAVADETAAPGNYVWIAPRWGTAQKLNIMTGTVVSNLSIPGGVELVKSGDYVWALHVGGSGAHRVHRSTDEITSFYDSHFTQGYGAAASDGYLWLSDPNSPILKKVHGETGALITTADFSSVLSGSIRSIRVDSLKIAVVAGSKMSFIDKTNLSIVRTIELPNDGGFTANEAWIMAEGGGAWFLSGGGGYKTIYRYDYHNNTGSYVNITIASIEGCAVNSTGFWVPSTWGSTMYHVKFDGTVDRTIELSSYGIYSYPKTRLAVGETVWVSTYQPQLHLLDFPEITYSNGQPVQ